MTKHIAILRPPRRRATRWVLAGLAVASAGLLLQWFTMPEKFGGFPIPPGLFYILGAAAIVWFDRRTSWSPLAAVALSAWIIGGGLAGRDLIINLGESDAGFVAGNVVMVLGLLAAIVTGVVAIVQNRRADPNRPPPPLSAANPRRTATIWLIVSLVCVAVGDGAPEALNQDGPGPILFIALAALVALIPGPFMTALVGLFCAVFLFGAFSNPEPLARLMNPAAFIDFGFQLLQILALLAGLLIAALMLWPRRESH